MTTAQTETAISTAPTTPFLSAGGFTYSVQVRPLQRPAGHFHVGITSQWAGARNPEASQNVLGLTMSREELAGLVTALQSGLVPQAV